MGQRELLSFMGGILSDRGSLFSFSHCLLSVRLGLFSFSRNTLIREHLLPDKPILFSLVQE